MWVTADRWNKAFYAMIYHVSMHVLYNFNIL